MTDPNPNPRGTRQAEPNSESKTSTSTSTNQIPGSNTGNPPSSNNNQNQPSLTDRIQSSATGLARSAFTGTSANDYAQTLSTATQGKAVPASASASSGAAGSGSSSTYANNVAPTSSSANTQHQAQPAPTFRNNQSRPPPYSIPNLTEEEFQRVYTDIGTYGRAYYTEAETDLDHAHARTGSFTSSTFSLEQPDSNQEKQTPDSTLQSTTGNWKGKHRLQDPVQKEYTTAWERATPHDSISRTPWTPTYFPVESDGDDVVDLLDEPWFVSDGDWDDWNEYELETELERPVTGTLSKEEREMLDTFRKEVHSESVGAWTGNQITASGAGSNIRAPVPQGSVPLSSASLVPDIDTFVRDGKIDFSLRDLVLSDLPGSKDWVELQDRYHDEVWGYLKPALAAARREMENDVDGMLRGDGTAGADGPAVRRLKMILKHMGGA